jgi:DNA-binding IclR family transcriptional regulator
VPVKLGVQRRRVLIALVDVAAAGIGLPDLDELATHRPAFSVDDATRHHDTFADGLADMLDRQIRIERRNVVRPETRRPQLDGFWVGVVQFVGGMAKQAAAVRRIVQPGLAFLHTGAVVVGVDSRNFGGDLRLPCHSRTVSSAAHGMKVRLPLSERVGQLAGNTSVPGATVTSRLLAVLGAFGERHRSLSLSEIARRAEIPVPTAHRLTRELVAGGALDRLDDGRYVIGRLVWEAGLLAPVQGGLRQVAEPFLHDVFAATMATVHLAVRDGDEVLYLHRMQGRASVPIVSTVGSRLPMHATGVGKVLLAHSPDDVHDRVLANLVRITPYTITRPDLLEAQLERIRRDGVATTSEEMSLGACSLAVPVVQSSDGAVVAAIGVVVATLKRDRQRLLGALQVAARGISRLL